MLPSSFKFFQSAYVGCKLTPSDRTFCWILHPPNPFDLVSPQSKDHLASTSPIITSISMVFLSSQPYTSHIRTVPSRYRHKFPFSAPMWKLVVKHHHRIVTAILYFSSILRYPASSWLTHPHTSSSAELPSRGTSKSKIYLSFVRGWPCKLLDWCLSVLGLG